MKIILLNWWWQDILSKIY